VFQDVGNKCQIINLGAGFDTLYWRLQDAGQTVTKFVDVDFPIVTAKKCHLIKKHKKLLDKLRSGGCKSQYSLRKASGLKQPTNLCSSFLNIYR